MDFNINTKYKDYSVKELHFGEFNGKVYFEFIGNDGDKLRSSAINTPWYFLEKDQAVKMAKEILDYYKE